MGKSSSKQSSELDPAIKAMMQETFGLGRDAITERTPVLDADGNQVYTYNYLTGERTPQYTEGLKEFTPYGAEEGQQRFADPSRQQILGETGLGNFLYNQGQPSDETTRLNQLYGDMYGLSSYSPDAVTYDDVSNLQVGIGPYQSQGIGGSRVASQKIGVDDIRAGQIDEAGILDAYNVASRDALGERVADPRDITAREVFEKGFDIERIGTPTPYVPETFAGRDLSPYTNPYDQMVRDVTFGNILETRDKQLSDLQQRAIQAKAFGGSREGVESGLIQGKALSEIAKQSALLGQQGFDKASQLALQDIGALNQGQLSNVQNTMEQQRLNQSTDLAAEQSKLSAAMEAQRLNQARDLSLEQFNIQSQQEAALANQANARMLEIDNATRDLQAQGMNQEDAYRTAQSNIDNKYRQQAANVANTMQADLANQSSSLEASLANQAADLQAQGMNQQNLLDVALANQSTNLQAGQFNQANLLTSRLANQQANLDAQLANQAAGLDAQSLTNQFGLDAQQLNQQGLLGAAGLASGANQAEVDRLQTLRGLGEDITGRDQQQKDFDYQQWVQGEEFQMMLAQFLGGLLSGFPTPLRSSGKESALNIW